MIFSPFPAKSGYEQKKIRNFAQEALDLCYIKFIMPKGIASYHK